MPKNLLENKLSAWKKFNLEIETIFKEKCQPIFDSEVRRLKLPPNNRGILNLNSIPPVIELLDKLMQQLSEYRDTFHSMDPKSVPPEILTTQGEIQARNIDFAFHYVQLKLIVIENYYDFIKLSKKSQKITSNLCKPPEKKEMISIIQEYTTHGWFLLQCFQANFMLRYPDFSELHYQRLSDRFALMNCNLLPIFTHRFEKNTDFISDKETIRLLNEARKSNDPKLCNEKYKKAITNLEQPNIAFLWRWEHMYALLQRCNTIISDNKFPLSKLETVNFILGEIIAENKWLAADLNESLPTIKSHYIQPISNDFNSLLFFLNNAYQIHAGRFNKDQREMWLSFINQMVEINQTISAKPFSYLEKAILSHQSLYKKALNELQIEKKQELENSECQRQELENSNQLQEEYNLTADELLSDFDITPPKTKKKSGKSRASAQKEEDVIEIDLTTESGVTADWLQVHLVTFFETNEEGKTKYKLNSSSLATSLVRAENENNLLEMIRLNFALGEFNRSQASARTANLCHLSNAIDYLDCALNKLETALELVDIALKKPWDTEQRKVLVDAQNWAKFVFAETDKLLSCCRNKVNIKIQRLEESKRAAMTRIMTKFGEEAWFRKEPIKWEDLSKKTRQYITLKDESEKLELLEGNFKKTNQSFSRQIQQVEKGQTSQAKNSKEKNRSQNASLKISGGDTFFNKKSIKNNTEVHSSKNEPRT